MSESWANTGETNRNSNQVQVICHKRQKEKKETGCAGKSHLKSSRNRLPLRHKWQSGVDWHNYHCNCYHSHGKWMRDKELICFTVRPQPVNSISWWSLLPLWQWHRRRPSVAKTMGQLSSLNTRCLERVSLHQHWSPRCTFDFFHT